MINWKSKALLAKMEQTYGVDSAPTGAANAILAQNVRLAPMEGEDVERNLERPYFGANPSIPVGLYSTLTFDVEAVGSGTAGTAPGYGPLLRMCGLAEVITAGAKVEYTPITDGQESGSIYFSIGTTRHVLLGARGTCVYKLNAQGIPMFSFTLTGLFSMPTTQPQVTANYSAFQKPQVATKANTPVFTVGGLAMVLGDFELNMGADVQRRLKVGYEGIHIVDRKEMMKAKVDAVDLATYNPFAKAIDQTEQEVVLSHGTIAGRKVALTVPAAQQKRLSGYEQSQNILEWPLDFIPQPISGNDQWSLSFT